MPSSKQQYNKASVATADNLKSIAHTMMSRNLSSLSLPEVDQAVDIVSKMVPAGNVPGVILNGLARITDRKPPPQTIKRDVNLLFQGVEQVLDRAAYAAFFAGPAAVIWGYQNLLKLAGKDPEDAFPQGTWQFYVDYALREDTARHANETHGFDTLLGQHNIRLSHVDRITAWVITAMQILRQYDALLENEWRERVYIHTANEISGGKLPRVYAGWVRQLPYGRRADAGSDTYPVYRRKKFNTYMDNEVLPELTSSQRAAWRDRIATLERDSLPAYQQQMSIYGYLQPEPHYEEHILLPLDELTVGLIYQGAYYLIPLILPATGQPNDVKSIRAQVAGVLQNPTEAANLTPLAEVRRAALSRVANQLNLGARYSLEQLQRAPILINADQRPTDAPLATIRQAERGVGSHALTIFDTGKTFVFDQSHIYFDGAWGAALAEIMTNEALSWAQYLTALPVVSQPNPTGAQILDLQLKPDDLSAIQQAPAIVTESCAETDIVNPGAILNLRKLFKQRSDLLHLTVNDLLVLYRAIHAVTYHPPPELTAELDELATRPTTQAAAQAAQAALQDRSNPAILIPVDASQTHPSERLYPMSFIVPLKDLDLIRLHKQTLAALATYQAASGDRSAEYEAFDKLQREYLATLAGFGAVLSRAKEIALAGESASSGTIKLLAHMSRPLQRLLDEIPSKVDLLNDIVKGREVFSNVGAVASSSTLTRFVTAKDDNEKKTLAWGVITDAERVMRVSLRDFRPHVRLLRGVDENVLANRITQQYLDSYASGLNTYIKDLRRITLASRETRMTKGFNNGE